MSNELQRTESWLNDRLGCVTASRVSDVMAKTKSGYSASRKNYMMQLLCERLTKRREETYINAAMQRGTDLEPVARTMFEMQTGLDVKETGFIRHPNGFDIGASPDGLVSDGGILEVKCPNTAQFIDFYLYRKIPSDYQAQMALQMACCNATHGYFVMFDDRLPEHMQLTYVKVERNEQFELEMMKEITLFLIELDDLALKVIQTMGE
jgi:putative phage-type endonuclease